MNKGPLLCLPLLRLKKKTISFIFTDILAYLAAFADSPSSLPSPQKASAPDTEIGRPSLHATVTDAQRTFSDRVQPIEPVFATQMCLVPL